MVKLPTELVGRIKRAAASERRSMTNWIEVTLGDALKGQGEGDEGTSLGADDAVGDGLRRR